MLTLNLGSLGITEEALTKAVLKELNLTPEQAIDELAVKLGVVRSTPTPDVTVVSDGQSVATDKGESVARVLSQDDVICLNRAGDILSRIRIG